MTLHKCMPRGVIVKKYLLSLILMLPLSIFVVAQDNESEDEVEEVVVTGIKKSLISAIDIKRNNVGVVDAITAEDFGKFPDNNLAESLARVVGIGIDRSNVEGERVAVRGFGPELNLVTLNGRQMPTVPGQWGGGRSFNFGDISSHGISAVEVYKSTNSSLPSGGIGSTINMVTTKPLSINGSLNSFSVDLLKKIQLVRMEQNLNLTLFTVQILENLVSQYPALFKIEIILKKAQENLTGLRLRI